ncbi:hypothetical protein TIFTF001_016700 [Ficus carica]|uniref:Uncharacterized protein n=1 Tax=Ficus carica TaxID=3494 RepID=A0AA88D6E1_FICCA|nr:hypothetical protein TIFTF001_016700 [Ficus carica]
MAENRTSTHFAFLGHLRAKLSSGRAVTPVAEKSGGPRPIGLNEWAKWLVCAPDMWSVLTQSEECVRAWTKWQVTPCLTVWHRPSTFGCGAGRGQSPLPLGQASRPGPRAPMGCPRDGAKAEAKGLPPSAIHLRVWIGVD